VEINDVGDAVSVSPPGDELSVATPMRGSEFEERNDLLKELAAPAKKAQAPDAVKKPPEPKKKPPKPPQERQP
jgi:hypothetical protein